MLKYLKRLFSLHLVRYTLVGGVGIPINLVALAVFLHVFLSLLYHFQPPPKDSRKDSKSVSNRAKKYPLTGMSPRSVRLLVQ
jgi:hypothetical protein